MCASYSVRVNGNVALTPRLPPISMISPHCSLPQVLCVLRLISVEHMAKYWRRWNISSAREGRNGAKLK